MRFIGRDGIYFDLCLMQRYARFKASGDQQAPRIMIGQLLSREDKWDDQLPIPTVRNAGCHHTNHRIGLIIDPHCRANDVGICA